MSTTTTAYTVQTIEVRPGAYRVETRTSSIVGQLINELTASFATEQVANRVADEIRDNSGQCAAEIREAVRDMLQYEYANECNRPYINQAYLADLERALDIFTPADGMDRLNEMAARMYDDMRARWEAEMDAELDAARLRTLDEIRADRKAVA